MKWIKNRQATKVFNMEDLEEEVEGQSQIAVRSGQHHINPAVRPSWGTGDRGPLVPYQRDNAWQQGLKLTCTQLIFDSWANWSPFLNLCTFVELRTEIWHAGDSRDLFLHFLLIFGALYALLTPWDAFRLEPISNTLHIFDRFSASSSHFQHPENSLDLSSTVRMRSW